MIGSLTYLPELQALEGMFELWQEEIVNDFAFRAAQGPVEGHNNRAKAVRRRAYGCRLVANHRRQPLLAG